MRERSVPTQPKETTMTTVFDVTAYIMKRRGPMNPAA